MLDDNLTVVAPRRVLRTIISPFLVAIALTLTLIVFVPFGPAMPQPDLDSSWEYAMNAVVAKHMVIGKDIIFTFGPLAAVLFQTVSPGHRRVDAVLFGSDCCGAVRGFGRPLRSPASRLARGVPNPAHPVLAA